MKYYRATISTHFYPIAPSNVHLYEDQLQININILSFVDDEGRVRHLLIISRKIHKRVANLVFEKKTMRKSPASSICFQILPNNP